MSSSPSLRLGWLLGLLAWSVPFFAQENAPFRIGILGCHRQFEPAPALVRYLESELDLALWVGDNIYADTQTDFEHLEVCYQALANKPAFQQLRQQVPYAATWDDHDYGDNNEWKDYPLKAESKALFRRFWQLEEKIPADQPGIYYAETLSVQGQAVQLILLDVRYHRDAPGGPTGDMLGEPQWTWLAGQLEQPADLRLIVSGTQVLLEKESGFETWDQYPQARRRLFDLLREKQVERVAFITGDQHYGEVCRMAGALDFDAVEFQFAGLNQTEDPAYNPLRVSRAAATLHSYALLDLQLRPTDTEVPHLLFRVFDAQTNQPELMYRVNLSELSLGLNFGADTAFAKQKQVQLAQSYAQLEIRYTLDGSEPQARSTLYTGPFELKQSTLVQARLFDWATGQARSRPYAQAYEKLALIEPVKAQPEGEGLAFRYVEGTFSRLPDFDAQPSVKQGRVGKPDLAAVGHREDHFAVEFAGWVEVPADGGYTFVLTSDDGSALTLHDRLIIDNDGSHSPRERRGKLALKKGLHPFKLAYFEDYSGQSLRLYVLDEAGEEVGVQYWR
jgi:alkaline phosphatase D